MSSDSPGGDGRGGQNENENMADAMEANAAITGEMPSSYGAYRAAGDAFNESLAPGGGSKGLTSAAQVEAAQAEANAAFGNFGLSQQSVNAQSQAPTTLTPILKALSNNPTVQNARRSLPETLSVSPNSPEFGNFINGLREDQQFMGPAAADAAQYQIAENLGYGDALRETEDFGSKSASKFGFHDNITYDPEGNNGVGKYGVSTNNFDPFDMPAVDLAATILSGGALAPVVAVKNAGYDLSQGRPAEAVLSLASLAGGNIGAVANTAAQVNDVASFADVDVDTLFGQETPFKFFGNQILNLPEQISNEFNSAVKTAGDVLSSGDSSEANFNGVFGDDGGQPAQIPQRQAQYFPTPNITPPIQQTASNAVPSPFDYYGKQYVKQQQQWDGNNFTPAPFVRRIV